MQSMQAVVNSFPITSEEYEELDDKFGELCHYQAWQLIKMNMKNNCTDDQEDIVQDLRIAMIKAASYFKRQTYIESCFSVLSECVNDKFVFQIITELIELWDARTRHGANRQKFGGYQEQILEQLVQKHVPKNIRPNKCKPLQITPKFRTYCKQITWNELKLKGKKITREKFWRTGMASLSEFEYLGAAS